MDLFNPADLQKILMMLQQSDTATIKYAEKLLKPFKKDSRCIAALMQQMQNPDAPSRLHAALMIKKIISKHYLKFPPSEQSGVRNALLQLVLNDTENLVKTAIVGCIATLSEVVEPDWPEVFNLLLQLKQHPSPQSRSLTFNLIAQLSEHIPDRLAPHTETLTRMFIDGIQDSEQNVSREAFMATSMFLSNMSNRDGVDMLAAVIGPTLNVLTVSLNKSDEELVNDGLDVLTEAALIDKPIINNYIDQIINLLVSIIESESMDPSTHQSAAHCLMTIIEHRPKLLTKKSLVPPIISSMVRIIAKSDSPAAGSLYTMATASKVRDNAYEEEEDDDYASKEEIHELAQSILDVMASNISAKHFAQPALSTCAECFMSLDSKIRKAGCSLLGIISEGMNDAIKPILSQILPQLLGLTRDPDQHVREAATFAAGQIAEHCQPDILFYHTSVMPAMFAAMDDTAPTVQGTACYVIEFFCEYLERSALQPYLPALLQRLGGLLSSTDINTVDMSLAAIASTAVAAELDFLPYTSAICQVLDGLIFLTEPSKFQIRGRALECLGHIALAVGSDNFSQMPYFERGMQSIAQAETLDSDSLKEFSYVYISNCAKAMGHAFIPRLGSIVPLLLAVVKESESFKADDDDDEEADPSYVPDEDEEDDNMYIKVEDGFVNTKKAAVGALGSLAEYCGIEFEPYLNDTFKAMIQEEIGSIHSFHSLVRAESLSILSQLLGVVCAKYRLPKPEKGVPLPLPQEVTLYTNAILNSCITIQEIETDKLATSHACEAIASLLEQVGFSAITVKADPNKKETFADRLMNNILKLLQEKAECQIKVEKDEDDSDDNHDNTLMDSVCDLIGGIAKSAGPIIVPYFDAFFELLLKFCRNSRPYTDRSMAIGCIGEVLNEIGQSAQIYAQKVIPVVTVGLQDETEAVRRNSAFCVAALIESTQDFLIPHYSAVLQILYPVCIRTCELSGAADSGGADIDNAISAVTRMIKIAPLAIPLEQVLPIVLKALPIKADFNEAKTIFFNLCDLLDSDNAATFPCMKDFLIVLAKSLGQEKVDNEVKNRIVLSIQRLASGSGAGGVGIFNAAVSMTDSDVQNILQRAITMR